jgi:hypothetical protein
MPGGDGKVSQLTVFARDFGSFARDDGARAASPGAAAPPPELHSGRKRGVCVIEAIPESAMVSA